MHQFLKKSDRCTLSSSLRTSHENLRKNRICLHKTEIEALENIFISGYMLNERSNHVFMNPSHTFMKCVFNPQRFFFVNF